jgi:hypothetical protein
VKNLRRIFAFRVGRFRDFFYRASGRIRGFYSDAVASKKF